MPPDAEGGARAHAPGPLRAVFFDLDDTLVLTGAADQKALAEVRALLCSRLPESVAGEVMERWQELFRKDPWDNTHKVPYHEWRVGLWEKALRGAGAEGAPPGLPEDLQQCFAKWRLHHFELEAGVQEMVSDLRRRGLCTAVITNGHPQIQRGKLERCRAAQLFDHLLIGGDEVAAGREEKPGAGIFLKACQLCGCAPHEAVHIGDNLATDVFGANRAGLAVSVWVNRGGGQPKPHQAPGAANAGDEPLRRPSAEVRHVTELPRALRDLGLLGPG